MTKTETACNSKRVASCFVIETDVFFAFPVYRMRDTSGI